MEFPIIDFSKKEKRTVILAVTIGNLLEWYEIYLYVYWAPIIAKLFFSFESANTNLIFTYLIFALGFLARPLGGLFFGRLGDRIGRKKAMVLSIMMMIFPTFVTGLLPTCTQVGCFAPIILAFMRILQAFPAGGELPGAFCYLYESSQPENRRYLSSFGAYGYQIGILISTIECFFLEKYLSPEDLMTWGWRASFIIGGLFGFFGLFLRYKLHETPLYQEMVQHHKLVKEPILTILLRYKERIVTGFLFCALNSCSFYLLSVNFPVYFVKILGISYSSNLIITALFLLLMTLPLPLFGKLADRYNNKKMLIISTVGMIALLPPLVLAINYSAIYAIAIIVVIYSLLFTCTSALIPYILCDLFPTYARFTCVGVSFNLVDAVIGGFTPAIALVLLSITKNQASFCYLLFFVAILSLIGYLRMKEKDAT
jgi:MHS family proline/betaine transporter-like MFS transporter